MAANISKSVGWNGVNASADVAKIHALLKAVPTAQGGPPPSFNASGGYTLATQQHIYNFQMRQFGWGDAKVDPGGQTLAKLNEIVGRSGVSLPSSQPDSEVNPPAPNAGGTMVGRWLTINVGCIVGGTPIAGRLAYVAGFSHALGKNRRFAVPLYTMQIGNYGDSWDGTLLPGATQYEVIRWGVSWNGGEDFTVQGTCLGDHVLSRSSFLENSGGSWRIKGEWYIHTGPVTPGNAKFGHSDQLIGALGCVEVCGGGKFFEFMEEARTRAFGGQRSLMQDTEDNVLTEAKTFRCRVEPSSRPPLVEVPDPT